MVSHSTKLAALDSILYLAALIALVVSDLLHVGAPGSYVYSGFAFAIANGLLLFVLLKRQYKMEEDWGFVAFIKQTLKAAFLLSASLAGVGIIVQLFVMLNGMSRVGSYLDYVAIVLMPFLIMVFTGVLAIVVGSVTWAVRRAMQLAFKP